MTDRQKMRSKLVGLIRVTVVTLGISLIAIYWYVSHLDSDARHTALIWMTAVISLAGISSALVGLNLIYFSAKLKATHSELARTIPRLLALMSAFLMFFALLTNYHLGVTLVLGYILTALVAFSAINVFVYLRAGRSV
jgi:hypothetical protein